MRKPASVAVAHLIRKSNGPAVFQKFLSTYKEYQDPVPHDLILIFKNFKAGEDKEYLTILEGTEFIKYEFPDDTGLDLQPYIDVSQHFSHKYFCFLNSFSQIECDFWLSHLYNAIVTMEDAGIVGATGSWESTGATDPPFPNPHIRTNAFLIPAEILKHIEFIDIKDKDDARRMESGHDGLTRQILNLGKKAYVVDRTGKAWPSNEWAESSTFRSGGQTGLIVSDNRTRSYSEGDQWTREYLYDLAWTGHPSKANPFKRQKIRHRIRRLFERRNTKKNL